jgi:hypothetical protein
MSKILRKFVGKVFFRPKYIPGDDALRLPSSGTPNLSLKRDVNVEQVDQIRVARFYSVQFTKTGKNLPNDQKTYEMVVKLSIWKQTMPTIFIPRPSNYTQLGIFSLELYLRQPWIS